jgi:hypothetical protein
MAVEPGGTLLPSGARQPTSDLFRFSLRRSHVYLRSDHVHSRLTAAGFVAADYRVSLSRLHFHPSPFHAIIVFLIPS